MTCTYTTLIWTATLARRSDPARWDVELQEITDGFTLGAVDPTSATAGSFQVQNPNGVTTDSGTGTGFFQAGSDNASVTNETPIQFKIDSSKGWKYEFDYTNQTIRIYRDRRVLGRRSWPRLHSARASRSIRPSRSRRSSLERSQANPGGGE